MLSTGLHKHRLIQALAYMLSSNLLVLGLALATTVIMARLMSPRDFGIIIAGEAFVALFSSLYSLGFRNAMFKVSSQHEDGFREGLNVAIGTGFFIKSLSVIPVALLTYWVAILSKASPDLLFAIGCYIFIESMNGFAKLFATVRRALGEFKLMSILGSTNKLLRLVLVYIVLKYLGDWKLLLALFAFFSIFKFLISYISTIRLFKPRIDFSQIPILLKDSLGYGLFDSLEDAQNRIDKVILNYLLGPASLAFYAIASRLNRLSKVLPQSINQVFLPTLYECYENARDRFLSLSQNLARFFALSGALTFLLIYYCAEFIVLKLFGSQYLESLHLVKLFAFPSLLLFLDKAPSLVLAVKGQHIPRIGSLVLSTILFIVLCLSLIPKLGIEAAIYASIIANTLRLIFLLIFSHKEIPISPVLVIALIPAVLAPFLPIWIVLPVYALCLYVFRLISIQDLRLLRNSFRSKSKSKKTF